MRDAGPVRGADGRAATARPARRRRGHSGGRDPGGPRARSGRHHVRRRVRQRARGGRTRTVPPGIHGDRLRRLGPARRHQRVGRGPAWPLLSGRQVRELSAAGLEIGSHGATHVRLGRPARPAGSTRRSAGARPALAGSSAPRSGASPIPTARWTRRRGRRSATRPTTTPAPSRLRRADLGLMALPRIYVGQRDGAARLTAKRLLYRGYVALRGNRP